LRRSPWQIVLPRLSRRGVLNTMSSTSFNSEEPRPAHERRRVPRLRLASLAYVDVDSDNGGILLNLSETGLALQAVAPFAGLTRVTLRIQPPKPRKRLDLRAEITWLSESRKEAGLQFLEVADDTRVEIANWISAEGGARELRATSDCAAPLPAPVSPALFPDEVPAPRRKWSGSLENSPSQYAPPPRKIPGELPSLPMASRDLELHAAVILPALSAEVPAQTPEANGEEIPAPTTSPKERPADPIVFSEQVSPAAASPSLDPPHRAEAPPRRQKWWLLQNSPVQDVPSTQKTPSDTPRRAVGSTYIERLTDAILRKNSVDVSPKNPISANEKTHARTGSPVSTSSAQADSSLIRSQNLSDAAQSASSELRPPSAPPARALPLPAAGLTIQPPPAASAEPIAKPVETPRTSIPSTSADIPRSGERRCITRKRVFSLAYLEVGSDNGGMVLDLSEGGLALQAFNPLIGLTRVNLRIQPPKSRKRIAATAEIAWLSETKTEAGLRFLDLTEDARTEIAEWISTEAAVPEPPSLDQAAAPKNTDVPAAQVSSAQTSPAPVYEGQDRNWEEWFPLFGDLNPEQSTANQKAFNNFLKTSTGSDNFALQPGSVPSQEFSDHSANDPNSFAQPLQQRTGDEKILAVARPVSSTPLSHLRRLPVGSPVSRAAASQPFLSEQFRKWGTIAVVCACIALVFLFLGMAISQGLLRDHPERLSAEEHPHDSGVSSQTLATLEAPVTHNASSGPAVIPSVPAVSRTRSTDSEIVSRAPQKGSRDKQDGENPKSRMTIGEADPIAAALPPAIAPSPETVKRDAQNTAVPSLPVWSVQAAANHKQTAGTAATNPAPLRVPERRSDCYLLYRVEPLYPREAREQRVEGTVMVHLQIGTDGRVRSSRELSGPAPLVPAALAAVREWRFIPALLNGQPIDAEKDVSIEFQLSR
jgi:TonB family protein